jgi:hypothetical protein
MRIAATVNGVSQTPLTRWSAGDAPNGNGGILGVPFQAQADGNPAGAGQEQIDPEE